MARWEYDPDPDLILPMTLAVTAFSLLVSDPAFLAMDVVARGMHLQLAIVAAARTPAGTLTGHEPTWRRYLGLGPVVAPAKAGTQGAANARLIKAIEGQAGVASMLGPWLAACEGGLALESQDLAAWQEHLWQTRWKPMLMDAWVLVDEALVQEKPHLSRALGGYYCAASEAIGRMQAGVEPGASAATGKRGKTSKKPGKAILGPVASPAPELEHDLEGCRQIGRVLEAWDTDLGIEARRSLWDVGAGILAGRGASAGERSRARGVLRKLIKDHGETAVAEAVGTLAARANVPADPTAFLVGMLNNKAQGGTPMEQKARGQRADVAL